VVSRGVEARMDAALAGWKDEVLPCLVVQFLAHRVQRLRSATRPDSPVAYFSIPKKPDLTLTESTRSVCSAPVDKPGQDLRRVQVFPPLRIPAI